MPGSSPCYGQQRTCSLAVECLIPEGFWRKGLKDTDPASEGALFILFSGLCGPVNFTTYDVPTAAA